MSKKKIGRPTKYRPEYDDQASRLALMGATMDNVAEYFDVNKDTIHEWIKVHPSFSDSIKKSQTDATMNIAGQLYQNCMNGDTTAQIFWMKARARWRTTDVVQVDQKPKPSDLDFEAMTDEQLEFIASLPRVKQDD